MTQEERQLLLIDICMRLPYRPFAIWHHKALNKFRDVKIMKVSTYGKNIDDYYINVLCQPEPGEDYEASIVDIKPYLRPMSSMNEEERMEFSKLLNVRYCEEDWEGHISTSYCIEIDNVYTDDEGIVKYPSSFSMDAIDWLNANHFDYRGLIEKGLALEAPEGMYNTKTE